MEDFQMILKSMEGEAMHWIYAITRQVDFLHFGRKFEQMFWQIFYRISTERDDLGVGKAIKRLIANMSDFVTVQFQMVHVGVSCKSFVRNGHYVIVAQIHSDQFGQKPKKDKDCILK